MIKRDPAGKTRKFLIVLLILFLLFTLLFILLKLIAGNVQHFRLGTQGQGIIDAIATALLLPIAAIPIIMLMSVVLKLVEKLIDRWL